MSREHKRERSNPTSISARAYTATIENKSFPFYLSRLSRCLGSTSPWWWCLFLFVRVLPFLCKERESVSMSAPTAQTSRFEREIRRERESGMMMMSRRSFAFAHTKKRAIQSALQRGKDTKKKKRRFFLTDILCVRAYERVG